MGLLADDRSWWERWSHRIRTPHSFTAVLPCDVPADAVRAALEQAQTTLRQAAAHLPDLHALRMCTVEAAEPPLVRILVNTVYDGPYLTHVAALAGLLRGQLGWPEDHLEMQRHLAAHRVPERTLFLANEGCSVERIRKDARLAEALRAWRSEAEAEGSFERWSLREARDAARSYIRMLPPDARVPRGPAPPKPARLGGALDAVATFAGFPLIGVLETDVREAALAVAPLWRRAAVRVGMIFWWLYAKPFALAALLLVRYRELAEPDIEPPAASPAKLDRIEALEDARRANELTVWFPVRPDWLGRQLMALTLLGSELGSRHLWTKGALAGAKNIHYARLLLVDEGRTMVFMSDYRGSFDAYVDHFIGVGGHTRAVVPISSRILGCPKTRWLFEQEDPPEFRRRWRALIRTHQMQAEVHYLAYPDLSANDILRNRRLRETLHDDNASLEEIRAWAREI